MNIKKRLAMIGYASWCGVGFVRGINSYNYNNYEKKEDYLYLSSLGYGIFGVVLYANPFFLPCSVYKEVYRFEVNFRNLENEKKTYDYNNLW